MYELPYLDIWKTDFYVRDSNFKRELHFAEHDNLKSPNSDNT